MIDERDKYLVREAMATMEGILNVIDEHGGAADTSACWLWNASEAFERILAAVREGPVMKYGIIFDVDDTLLATSNVYYSILIELMASIESSVYPRFVVPDRILEVWRMIRAGDGKGEVRDMLLGMNIENSEQYPDRWPKELAETFVECCLEAGKIPSTEEVKKAYALGVKIFDCEYRLLPGAVKIVNYLAKKRNTRLFIITHGSKKLQVPKVSGRDVFKKFEKIIVCPISISKGVEIKKLVEEYDDIDTWIMVGDSIPSDINPALACGIWAFNVRQNMSCIAEGKVIDVGSSKDKYRSFKDLAEVEDFMRGAVYSKEETLDAGVQVQVQK